MLPEAFNRACFSSHTRHADVAVVEGVMGLFDGYNGKSEAGSTAQMAKVLGLPVILVVDAKSMARSAAALVMGFEKFDPAVAFAGVLFNKVGSPRHLNYLSDALDGRVGMPVLGGIDRSEKIAIPERHLGLYTTDDHPLTAASVSALADLVDAGVDVDGLMAGLPDVAVEPAVDARPAVASTVRIGVARDNAFCFYYQDNLDLMAANGAKIVPFSPMADSQLPADIDGLYFGGGYPELFASRLAENRTMRNQIRLAAGRGMPVYGECGGFMYLGEGIVDVDGRHHPMAGCFPLKFKMFSRLKSLGYREATLTEATLIGPAGTVVRGHEFHYSEIDGGDSGPSKVYRVTTREGLEKNVDGYQLDRCLGSYLHLHFGSNPQAARAFVAACLSFQSERMTLNET
jgi:cobyrinic acid a,c-diamide synthase